uniref:Lipopolysaccharide heptosyltransferase family protein n=1 Tax=candidate division WOR-3 bacterium TaxID=2052148 RepID=A0A7C2PLK1_UNCW3
MQSKFYFNGKLGEAQRCVFIVPENPLLFSYSLYSIWNFVHYFKKTSHIFYPVDGKVDLLKSIFPDHIYWFKFKKEKEFLKAIYREKGITLVINLDYGESKRYDLLYPTYSFAISNENLKNFTVVFKPLGQEVDVIYRNFASTFGIPKKDFHISLSSEEKSKARDYIKFRGHTEKNILVVSDLNPKREALVKQYLSYLTKDRLTFIDKESLWVMDSKLILAILSLADLFLSELSIFTYPAQVLGVKTYLFSEKVKFLPRETGRLIIDRGDFKKALSSLIGLQK